jgi:hypothetical protein
MLNENIPRERVYILGSKHWRWYGIGAKLIQQFVDIRVIARNRASEQIDSIQNIKRIMFPRFGQAYA